MMLYDKFEVSEAPEEGSSETPTRRLVHYCKNCLYTLEEDLVSANTQRKSYLVSETNLRENHIQSRDSAQLNQNILHDPTLPHVKNVHCPNGSCTKPPEEESEVIFSKYDDQNLRFVYYCKHCEHTWNN